LSWQVNPNSKWQASIGRAVSIISSITESVFGRAEDNATHEHQEAQARDDRSTVSVAPLPLLTVFVPAVEAASTNINNGTVEDAPTIDEPEARPLPFGLIRSHGDQL
jgi:hypothetical protein